MKRAKEANIERDGNGAGSEKRWGNTARERAFAMASMSSASGALLPTSTVVATSAVVGIYVAVAAVAVDVAVNADAVVIGAAATYAVVVAVAVLLQLPELLSSYMLLYIPSLVASSILLLSSCQYVLLMLLK